MEKSYISLHIFSNRNQTTDTYYLYCKGFLVPYRVIIANNNLNCSLKAVKLIKKVLVSLIERRNIARFCDSVYVVIASTIAPPKPLS
jgi:hypothetical protein